MARFEDKALAAALGGDGLPPCPAMGAAPCAPRSPPPASLHERWERAIARLQGVVACSPQCPLADHLLAVVRELGLTTNPLSEVFPELDPAPAGGRRSPKARARMENPGGQG